MKSLTIYIKKLLKFQKEVFNKNRCAIEFKSKIIKTKEINVYKESSDGASGGMRSNLARQMNNR